MRLSLFFFVLLATALLSKPAFSQNCPPNIGFEAGNFGGWQCFTGTTQLDSGENKIILTPSPPTIGRHEIISANNNSLTDLYGLFPKLCPFGGKYSVKLGNNVGGAQAEGLSYTFQIPAGADSFALTYFYAVVLQNPTHPAAEQPRFLVSAYDVLTGEQVSCASFNYVASGGIPGFKKSPVDTAIVFKDWTPGYLQLAGLGGRTVRLEFRTADCTQGQHFGYAYIDVSSVCSSVVAAASYCTESNSLILDAPHGFQSYTWYDSNYVVVGNQQSVTLTPPPVTSGAYYVGVVPYFGYGCANTLRAIVKPAPTPDTPSGPNFFVYCQGYPMPQLTATASPGNLLLWYTGPNGGIPSSSAPIPLRDSSGVFEYYVAQKALLGCEGPRKKITVKVTPVPVISFTVNKARQCENANQFVFTNTSTNISNPVFNWDFGDGERQSSPTDTIVTHTYTKLGNYLVWLRITNDSTCFSTGTMTVTVIPKPVARFTYPSNICEQQTPLSFTDNSGVPGNVSRIDRWWWNINGIIATTQSPASATANMGGAMPVQLVVTTAEGCVSDTNNTIVNIRHRPKADFSMSNLCDNETISFTDRSQLAAAPGESIVKWQWVFDSSYNSSTQNPSLNFVAGPHTASLVTETNYGCKSQPKDSTFTVYAKPNASFTKNDSCVNRTIIFLGNDPGGNISKWTWNFGNGAFQHGISVDRKYNAEGIYPLTLVAQTQNGCKDTITRTFTVYGNKAFAGRDTIAANNDPVQLHANGGANTTYVWSPAVGLSNANIENPVAVWDRDQRYELVAITDKGCDSRSSILIKRFDKSTIYIPSGFTPNGDSKNDFLTVVPVGIKSFKYFIVFNRWGEVIYKSTDASKGWNGTWQGLAQPTGTFVVLAEGIDYRGRTVIEKTTVTLIR